MGCTESHKRYVALVLMMPSEDRCNPKQYFAEKVKKIVEKFGLTGTILLPRVLSLLNVKRVYDQYTDKNLLWKKKTCYECKVKTCSKQN